MAKLPQKTKVTRRNPQNQKNDKNLKTGEKGVPPQPLPRSYRLDPEILAVLKETLAKINAKTPKKISESRLVKALIWLSQDQDVEKILKALKEVW